MSDITYENIVGVILKKFPEYKNSEEYFDESMKDLPYIVLGNLSLMAFENIDTNLNISLAEKLVKFTDEIINDANSEDKLINAFQVQVFEQIVGSRTGAKLAEKLLHGKSVELLEQTLKHYHANEFLDEYKKSGFKK